MTEERTGFDIELLPYNGRESTPYQSKPRKSSGVAKFDEVRVQAKPSQGKTDASMDLRNEQIIRKDPAQRNGNTTATDRKSNESFDHEIVASRSQDGSTIQHLIVATKAASTAAAVKLYAHRMTKDSSILFLQNGIGVLDEVSDTCFPDPSQRPQYIVGVNSHGLRRQGMFFDVRHIWEGSIALGTMPDSLIPENSRAPPSLLTESAASQYLIRTMTRTPVFVCGRYPPTDLFQLQLDKLAIDAVVGPLTAILDVKNGAFNQSFHLTRTLRLLLAETCHVVRNLPELENVPNVKMRFDTARVEQKLWEHTRLAANSDSSMLQDLRAIHSTEINHVNGYIIKRGEQLGMYCIMNYMIMQLVKAKCTLIKLDRQQSVPVIR